MSGPNTEFPRLGGHALRAIHCADDGTLYAGGDQGTLLCRREGGRFERIETPIASAVSAITSEPGGALYCNGGSGELWRFDGRGFERCPVKGAPAAPFHLLFRARDGVLYAASRTGDVGVGLVSRLHRLAGARWRPVRTQTDAALELRSMWHWPRGLWSDLDGKLCAAFGGTVQRLVHDAWVPWVSFAEHLGDEEVLLAGAVDQGSGLIVLSDHGKVMTFDGSKVTVVRPGVLPMGVSKSSSKYHRRTWPHADETGLVLSASQAWAVGDGFHGLCLDGQGVLHRVGDRGHIQALDAGHFITVGDPPADAWRALAALPGGEMLAAADSPFVLLHRTNEGWARRTLPSDPDVTPDMRVIAMQAFALNDLWFQVNGPFTRRSVVHFDGERFEWWSLREPATGDWSFSDRATLWGSGANDVWVGGDTSTMFHWSGHAWSRVDLPVETPSAVHDVWGTARNDVWARTRYETWHHDGACWLRKPHQAEDRGDASARCTAVSTTGDIYTADENGQIFRQPRPA